MHRSDDGTEQHVIGRPVSRLSARLDFRAPTRRAGNGEDGCGSPGRVGRPGNSGGPGRPSARGPQDRRRCGSRGGRLRVIDVERQELFANQERLTLERLPDLWSLSAAQGHVQSHSLQQRLVHRADRAGRWPCSPHRLRSVDQRGPHLDPSPSPPRLVRQRQPSTDVGRHPVQELRRREGMGIAGMQMTVRNRCHSRSRRANRRHDGS